MIQVIEGIMLIVVSLVTITQMIDLSNILISKADSVLIASSSKKKDIILSYNHQQTDFMIIAKDITKEIVLFISVSVLFA